MNWPFADDKSTVAVTSQAIVRREATILYVSHERDEDGDIVWQFHQDPNNFDFGTAKLVRLDTMLSVDPSLSILGDLPIGWQATRENLQQNWTRSPIS
jgi:hypothetical protein